LLLIDGAEPGKGPVAGMKSVGGSVSSEVPFVPSSPMELFLTAVLCVVSTVVVAYTMVMLYRCVCSRNYAEWRASWATDGEGVTADGTTQVRERSCKPACDTGNNVRFMLWVVGCYMVILKTCVQYTFCLILPGTLAVVTCFPLTVNNTFCFALIIKVFCYVSSVLNDMFRPLY
jgi:hypothetical protein